MDQCRLAYLGPLLLSPCLLGPKGFSLLASKVINGGAGGPAIQGINKALTKIDGCQNPVAASDSGELGEKLTVTIQADGTKAGRPMKEIVIGSLDIGVRLLQAISHAPVASTHLDFLPGISSQQHHRLAYRDECPPLASQG